MNKLAAADGMTISHIQQLVAASQAGNPQATQIIGQYHARAVSVLNGQNNPLPTNQQPDTTNTTPVPSDGSSLMPA